MNAPLVASIILAAAVRVAAAQELLTNGGFDAGIASWGVNAPPNSLSPCTQSERKAAHLAIADDAPIGWYFLYQEAAVSAGDVLEAGVSAMSERVSGGYGVYAAIEFYNASHERLSFSQTPAVSRDGVWTELAARSIAPPEAVRARLCLLLNGHGHAYFSGARFARAGNLSAGALEGPVTLTVTDRVVCSSIIGFGAEDDGWFYNDENAEHGVTAEDVALHDARIEWMSPDWVRMFFWYKDWNPSGDWETFSFDNSNMQSHCRALDVYQRIGAAIDVTGVEWGVADPYGQPEKTAKAIGALFDYLIRTKGYSCVQQWTLTNEPNGAFAAEMKYSFERFVQLHALVKQEFARRALNVRIVGSDDTSGLPWFTDCVNDPVYFDLADFFVSHHYLPYADRLLAPSLLDDRLELLAKKTPGKPFAVAEFGFQDARSGALVNPLMETYPYAVWTAAFIIEGLNRGVAGFSVWCLSEVYYPGNGFMNYGLWDYKDNAWKVRPVYHAAANFTRLTKRGDRVRACVSSHPNHVIATLVGDTLFWVNQSDDTAEVRIAGLPLEEVRIMTEKTLEGDRLAGVSERLEQNRFTAPPQSFGYAR